MSTVKVSGSNGELSVEYPDSVLAADVASGAEQVAYSTLGELANKLSMLSDPSDTLVEAEASHQFSIDGVSVTITGRASFRSAPGLVHVAATEAAFRVATGIIMGMKPIDPMRTMKLLGGMQQVAGTQPQVPVASPAAQTKGGDDFLGGQYL